jgi:hypothetical protein
VTRGSAVTTNPQPSYAAEYLWLALTVVWLIVVGGVVRDRFRRPPESRRRSDV